MRGVLMEAPGDVRVEAHALRPLVDSGQVQMANHTWSRPYLNRMGLSAVADHIRRNADFLTNTYGVNGTPYFRPPQGAHNADFDRVAADLGYTTVTMWSGDVGDRLLKGIAHVRNTSTPPARCGVTVYMLPVGKLCRSIEFDGRR